MSPPKPNKILPKEIGKSLIDALELQGYHIHYRFKETFSLLVHGIQDGQLHLTLTCEVTKDE